MIREKLKYFRKTQELVALGRRNFSDEHLICQIRSVSESLVQVTEYDHNGAYNGISFLYIDDITDLLWDTFELKSLGKLARMRTPFEVPELKLGSLRILLLEIKERFGSVVLFNELLGNVGMYGEVMAVDAEWIELHEFLPKGNPGRFHSLVRLDLVTRITTDAPYLAGLIRLHETMDATN